MEKIDILAIGYRMTAVPISLGYGQTNVACVNHNKREVGDVMIHLCVTCVEVEVEVLCEAIQHNARVMRANEWDVCDV